MATAAQLKKLRKKYGLGEFRGKGKTTSRRRRKRLGYAGNSAAARFYSDLGVPELGSGRDSLQPVSAYRPKHGFTIYDQPIPSKGAGAQAAAALEKARAQQAFEIQGDVLEGIQQ